MKNLEFRKFYVEMLQLNNQKELLKEIIYNLINGNKSFFSKKGILAQEKSDYWILNYLNRNDNKNEYSKLARGLVVKKPDENYNNDPLTLINSFPFTRFFNKNEPQADPVDLLNSEMIEKLDGTMVAIFFPNKNPNNPEFHTRKMLSTHGPDMNMNMRTFYGENVTYLKIIKSYVDKLKFSQKDVENTYVFEFIHSTSKVVTKYTPDQFGLYLIGGRNLITHEEYSESDLNKIAHEINSKRPRLFQAIADHNEITKMFKKAAESTPDFEGFIFRDKKTGYRVKVKDPDYVKKHHVLDKTNIKSLIPVVLNNEENEVLSYYPDVLPKIKLIKEKIKQFKKELLKKVLYWKDKNLDKSTLASMFFAKKTGNRWDATSEKPKYKEEPEVRYFIMKHVNKSKDQIQEEIDKEINAMVFGFNTNFGNIKRFMELVGIEDTDEQTERQE